jgi:lipopolysaccharide transport system permease protein
MVLFNTAVRLFLIAAVMAWWHVVPGPGLPLFPVAVLALILAGFAVGLAVSPIGALYGDISRSIPVITAFWMLLTPVVYPARSDQLLGLLSTWNPVSPLVTTAREALVAAAFTNLLAFSVVGVTSVVLCIAGLSIFRIIMPRLIERMGA